MITKDQMNQYSRSCVINEFKLHFTSKSKSHSSRTRVIIGTNYRAGATETGEGP